jgi:epoxyqueuosine reductase QueG
LSTCSIGRKASSPRALKAWRYGVNYRRERNLAVAMGNASYDPALVAALTRRRDSADPLVAEHIDWAIVQLTERQRVTAA